MSKVDGSAPVGKPDAQVTEEHVLWNVHLLLGSVSKLVRS